MTWRGKLLTAGAVPAAAAAAASSACCLNRPFQPWVSITSASPTPSLRAAAPPTAPSTPVATPEPAAKAACLAESSPLSVSWRMDSAAEPAPATPSPMAVAAMGASLGAAAITPRPTTPPPPIRPSDSPMVNPTSAGFVTATLALSTMPSASANSRLACLVASECQSSAISRASLKRTPTSSRALPAFPPVTRSATPTAASGTLIAAFTAVAATSWPQPLRPRAGGASSPPHVSADAAGLSFWPQSSAAATLPTGLSFSPHVSAMS